MAVKTNVLRWFLSGNYIEWNNTYRKLNTQTEKVYWYNPAIKTWVFNGRITDIVLRMCDKEENPKTVKDLIEIIPICKL